MNNIESTKFLEIIKSVLRPFLIIFRFTKIKMREKAIKINPIKISDKNFLNIMNYRSTNELLFRKEPKFHINTEKKEEILSEISRYPELISKCLDDADKICNHVFDFLGSGERIIGEDIDWNCDFKSNYQWNFDEYYLGTVNHLKYIEKGINADVKIPWELSRFQHIVTIGKAFWYTEDEKYVKEFIKQIKSWIKNNPVELGVNWTCTMDVAIRAVNWIWGYYFFSKSNLLTEEFKIEFLKSLYLHGRHIMNNLEFGEIRGNHYLSNIAGLVYLGIFFQESNEGKEWLKKGISALIEELDYQVFPDGVNTELSINYHRLTTEIFVSTTLLCLKNNIQLPKSYMDRLERMFDFILYYTKPDGSAPQIGDCDDGRFHILSNYFGWDKQDHRYLLSLGAGLFGRNDFKLMNHEFDEEAFWLLGGLEKPNTNNYPAFGSKSFENSGFHIMRHKDMYMIIEASSPNPKYLQGHRHNSALSFELFAHDKSFIIDPGSYIYTSDKRIRNLFRSTQYHNTVKVDCEEQNTFNNDLFYLGTEAKTRILNWKIDDQEDFFDGEHYGYKRLKDPVIHRRQIIFNKEKGFWFIKDILNGKDEHLFDLHLHLAPMKLEPYDLPYSFISMNKKANIAIIPLEIESLSVEVLEENISPSYGKKIKAPVLKYSKEAKGETIFSNLIIPFKKKDDLEEILSDFEDKNNIMI
ncbi:alginate lyase family protein [Methanobacterium sp.]|uniref:alginate lyase family protein n=1 Tax=Methanobacterium sp. TaxID=2164 RepID=UPI0031597200